MKSPLSISRRKRRLTQILLYVGLLAAIPTALSRSWLLFFLCFLAAVIGALWLDGMYRCPQCGHSLFPNRQDALLLRPCSFCPKCGWAVDIEMKP